MKDKFDKKISNKIVNKLKDLKELKFSPFIYTENIPKSIERTIRIKTLPVSKKHIMIKAVIDYSRTQSGRFGFILSSKHIIIRSKTTLDIYRYGDIARVIGFQDNLEQKLAIKLKSGKEAIICCDKFGWYIYSILDYLVNLQELA